MNCVISVAGIVVAKTGNLSWKDVEVDDLLVFFEHDKNISVNPRKIKYLGKFKKGCFHYT